MNRRIETAGRKITMARGMQAAILSLVLLLGVGGATVYARQADKQVDLQTPLVSGSIGVVDMDRLYAASGGPEQLAQKATEITTELTQRLKDIKGASMLDQNELQEFGSLIGKATKNEAEQARVKALKGLSDQRQDELNRLLVKPDDKLTPEDKTRMKELQEQSQLLSKILPYLQEDTRLQQTERVEAYRRGQLVKIREIVGKVAAERGVAHVFDMSALVYSANDLTTLALPRVSKKAGK